MKRYVNVRAQRTHWIASDHPLTFPSDYGQSPLDNERRSKFSASRPVLRRRNGNKPRRNFDYLGPLLTRARLEGSHKTDKLRFIRVLIEIGVHTATTQKECGCITVDTLTVSSSPGWKQVDRYLCLRFSSYLYLASWWSLLLSPDLAFLFSLTHDS